jgi:hypothetical protein
VLREEEEGGEMNKRQLQKTHPAGKSLNSVSFSPFSSNKTPLQLATQDRAKYVVTTARAINR